MFVWTLWVSVIDLVHLNTCTNVALLLVGIIQYRGRVEGGIYNTYITACYAEHKSKQLRDE